MDTTDKCYSLELNSKLLNSNIQTLSDAGIFGFLGGTADSLWFGAPHRCQQKKTVGNYLASCKLQNQNQERLACYILHIGCIQMASSKTIQNSKLPPVEVLTEHAPILSSRALGKIKLWLMSPLTGPSTAMRNSPTPDAFVT